jgi:uncharacterized cupin superfamily protein/glyoxylase-like metal-dependent hydrolase (beta-lactamase superfamily II)
MIARLKISDGWMWSAWQPDRGMVFNSYLFERDGGCVAINPLPLDASAADEIEALGGVHTIVLTSRDQERATAELAARFGARVLASTAEAPLFTVRIDSAFDDRAEVFPGAFAVALPHGETPGEVALRLPDAKTAVVGDALIGAPAGALSLPSDEKLENKTEFVFALRSLWELELESLLLCEGAPIFGGADAAIGALLFRAGGPSIHRINADEIEYRILRPGKYACDDGEVGLLIGARKLGYRLTRIPPGRVFCPLHWHVRAEEFFYVIAGHPTIRTLEGAIDCRPGDFIAFPTGIEGAHQVLNDGDGDALVLLVGVEEAELGLEACFYPDSDKVGMWTPAERLRIVRASPDLNYYDGELTN